MREKLRSNGRIRDITFFRYLTYEDIKGIIEQAFSLTSKFIFRLLVKNETTVCFNLQRKSDYFKTK